MLLQANERLLIVHRRLFERDGSRFFVGVVDSYESGIVRVTGYTFLRDPVGGSVFRKHDQRTKLFSILSGTLIVYVLPRDLDVASAQIHAEENNLLLRCGNTVQMDLSEWVHTTTSSGW